MALWGNKDDVFSPGSITVDYTAKTITGSGTSFLAASLGDVISIGVGNTFGEAVISKITSQTLISIASTQWLSGSAISGVSGYTISQKPKYILQDVNYSRTSTSSTNKIYGVDPTEAEVQLHTTYAVTHAGWVGIKTYVDSRGNLRVKNETLVALSGITDGTTTYTAPGDAADDASYLDRILTIITQPLASTGIGSTPATFAVVASVNPSTTITYQWQSSPTGLTYTNVSNGAVYSGVTEATLSVGSTTGSENGYYYRSLVSSDGATTLTSSAAALSIVRLISITGQPIATSVGVGTTATFSVTASSLPSGTLRYQWQRSTVSGGATFANLGVSTTSNIVSVANTNTSWTGYNYRVVVSAALASNVTSGIVSLTVSP